jgi:hypothetical protein
LRAFAIPAGFSPNSISLASIAKDVTLFVIAAVFGASLNQLCTSAFCAAIAETPTCPPML